MPLLRTVIIVGAVIALLPSDRAQQERMQQAAVDAAHWTVTFCDRNAKTCENADAAWQQFKVKAEFAASVAYDIAMTHLMETRTAAIQPGAPTETSALPQRGTLTVRDLEPNWRGGELARSR